MMLGGLNLTRGPFEALLARDGIPCEVRRGAPCPCAAGTSKVPESGCPGCSGLGYTYPPGLRTRLSILITGRNKQATGRGAGPVGVGTCSATFPGGTQPRIGDQIWPEGELVEVEQLVVFRVEHKPAERAQRIAIQSFTAPPAENRVRRPGLLLYPGIGELIWAGYLGDTGTVEITPSSIGLFPLGNSTQVRLPSDLQHLTAISVRYQAPAVYMVSRAHPTRRLSAPDPLLPSRVDLIGLDRWGLEEDTR